MRKLLTTDFFDRTALEVAPDLLGKFLVRTNGSETIARMIMEVEAYNGPDDLACHASKGRTKRTDVMFGAPGVWYVYLIHNRNHRL